MAKTVWICINERLSRAFLDTIEVNESNIIYKINMPTPQSDLISEVNGSLWKNRYFKVLYDKTVV